jgi:hypothetical protein
MDIEIIIMTAPTPHHPAFTFIRSENIDALNLSVEEYHHKATGAVHYHLAADNPENVFLVALRTVPMDSKGVAHILEHTALCGSEKYPVRDPFFMMIRRSLNTFMNAFTSSDWTAYPFASQNKKDFNNLLDVYLDAVFFSRLDELDFAQEGHRLEFSEPENPGSDLVYKGVVFNEMKGAMSSVPSTLWHTLCSYLYPNNTYHFNSGGDPEHIPDLSYQELKSFYETHYHPSNAIFMTFGDIPAAEHQAKFEHQALSRFNALDEHICVENEKRYYSPVRVQSSYAYSEPGIDAEHCVKNKTHIVIAWLLGQNTSLEDTFTAHLISGVLLDNSASPLQKMLETTNLGSAPSPLIGLEDSNKELAFVCGIEGSNAENADEFEAAVMAVLEDVAENGIEQSKVEAVLHQLELHQREIGGDSYPYGLQLILSALTPATHYGDPIAYLNIEPVLNYLHNAIKDPAFIKDQVKKLLISNQHRVRLVMTPDQNLSERRDQAETDKLAAIKAALSETQQDAIISQSKALAERQMQIDDDSVLPKVGLEDVPHEINIPTAEHSHGAFDTHFYAQGTNGLVYQQIVIELPALTEEQQLLLPYYTHCLTELGCGELDYLQTQDWQSSVCGSISAFTSSRGAIDDEQNCQGYLVLSAKALASNQGELTRLMQQTLSSPRYDEHSRIREIVSQIRARREQGITGNGHGLAMLAASSGFSPTAQLSHRLSGLVGIQNVKAMDSKLSESESAISEFAEALAQIHQLVMANAKRGLIVAEGDNKETLLETFSQGWQAQNDTKPSSFSLAGTRHSVKQLWKTNTQVNFCAKAYPTVPMAHPDAAALSVLGGYLRNGYLHRVIREQGGAYGGGASQDSSIAAFRFYSYRDPRLVDTLDDFDKALAWLRDEPQEAAQLEEAILGVIGSLDKPGSPAGEAKQAYHNELFGRTPDVRNAFRNRVLAVTLEDLKRVSAEYLIPEAASIAVVTNSNTIDELPAEFTNVFDIVEV